ncbi:MAG: hypothetical protein KJO21_05585 [Verrucomicrobiae bacterium]|nr:hypothetical protein [Verrucomicrobiae bacterium]NNJ43194.1 hypothetical protein [Akkermansiaceae bacterium]
MKFTIKSISPIFGYSLIALLSLVYVLPSAAFEQRLFYSAKDKSKSFEAKLLDYDPIKKVVRVTLKSGKTTSFALSLLSEEDQEYVRSHAVILAVGRDVKLSLKEIKGEVEHSKDGLIRRSATPRSYEVSVYNRSDQIIEDFEVRYSFYYCVGSSSVNGPKHSPQVQKGTLLYPKLFGKYTETRTTSEVVMIRENKKRVDPPARSGGRGGGG